jgi:hypothetical protein
VWIKEINWEFLSSWLKVSVNSLCAESKPCLVSCSVLKEELEKLVRQGDLDADLVFVSKYFHVDYEVLERNLRKVVEKTLSRAPGKVIIVYGDLCLGPNDEMRKLTEEYGVLKVDALNCVDCLLGGKGKVLEADPTHDLLFLYPGMTGFFSYFKEKAQQEGIDEEVFNKFFSGLRGIALLDTLGDPEKDKAEIEKLNTGLEVVETKTVGVNKLKELLLEVIEQNRQKACCKK